MSDQSQNYFRRTSAEDNEMFLKSTPSPTTVSFTCCYPGDRLFNHFSDTYVRALWTLDSKQFDLTHLEYCMNQWSFFDFIALESYYAFKQHMQY